MDEDLIARLLRLFPKPVPEEDFFTEVIAWLLQNNPSILREWISDCLKIDFFYSGYQVETQVEFQKLDNHLTNSRPDIVITLVDDLQKTIIFVESKIGAIEGFEQLPRYADHLENAFSQAQNLYLVYLSRSFDPKETKYILRNIKSKKIDFVQARWNEFYKILVNQPYDPLISEIMKFMRKRHMSKITKITPSVLTALNSFPDVYNFFHLVLDAEMSAKLTEVIGKQPRSEGKQWWNLSEMRRYLLITDLNDYLLFFIGFLLWDSSEKYPSITASFQIRPSASNRERRIKILKQIINDTASSSLKWIGENLDKPGEHSSIYLEVSLDEILFEADHIQAIKLKFFEFLDEFARVIKNYPELISE